MDQLIKQVSSQVLPLVQETVSAVPSLLINSLKVIQNGNIIDLFESPVKSFQLILLLYIACYLIFSVVCSIGKWIKWLMTTLVYCSVVSMLLYVYALHGPGLIKKLQGHTEL